MIAYLIYILIELIFRLSGSSAVSETYGNPCLAQSEDFQVKEVEVTPNSLFYSPSE